MDRRDFLFLGAAVAASLWPRRSHSGPSALDDRVRFGRWVLAHLEHGDRAAARDLARTIPAARLADYSAIAASHEVDLAHDRTVDVDGWFLSRTEALNWAALAIAEADGRL